MAKQGETKFKEKVVRKLKTVGGLWLVKVQQVAVRGTPDILFCYRGLFFAWELKVGDNTASGLQQYNLDRIAYAGGCARVVSPENFDQCFEEIFTWAV